MIFFAKIRDGKLIFKGTNRLNKFIGSLKDCTVEIKIQRKKRSLLQNRSLHLWFTQLAEALNDAGYDVKKVIRKEVDIPWTAYAVKEYLWRPVQIAYLQKQSTTKLETQDIDKIFDIVNKVIGERTGVYCEFPNIELFLSKE